MSFEIRLMMLVERVLVWARKREGKKNPDDAQKLADIEAAIGEVRQDRLDAAAKDAAAKDATD